MFALAISITATSNALSQSAPKLQDSLNPTMAPQYTPSGELKAPKGFESWIFVGSNLGLVYKEELAEMTPLERERADEKLFHNIYINPESYEYFRANHEFPDQTVLVMQRFTAADKAPKNVLTAGVYNGENAGLEVAVKNASRPPGNCSRPNGSRTPWAYYHFTDPADKSKIEEQVCAEPNGRCESCHRAHAKKDNVWVQFYPTLRKLLE